MARDAADSLSCPRAGRWLSAHAQSLVERLADDGPAERPRAGTTVNWGGVWHCPADGLVMVPEPGGVRCPACGRRLTGSVLYEIIEFNPHVEAEDGQ